jgi:hypothetical protein
MKRPLLLCVLALLVLSGCRESEVFEYSSFYNNLSSEIIQQYFQESFTAHVPNVNVCRASTTFNGVKKFYFVHEIKEEDDIDVLLAYGDGIVSALKREGFFVGALNNPRYHKRTSPPLEYVIHSNNANNICSVTVFLFRTPDNNVTVVASFHEYANKN